MQRLTIAERLAVVALLPFFAFLLAQWVGATWLWSGDGAFAAAGPLAFTIGKAETKPASGDHRDRPSLWRKRQPPVTLMWRATAGR